jgi:hypothetical protein
MINLTRPLRTFRSPASSVRRFFEMAHTRYSFSFTCDREGLGLAPQATGIRQGIINSVGDDVVAFDLRSDA